MSIPERRRGPDVERYRASPYQLVDFLGRERRRTRQVCQRYGAGAIDLRVLKILNALRGGELSVTELVEATGAGQANVSKHLGLLLTGGLVARRKEGTLSYYYIADETIFQLCETVCDSLGERLAAQREAFGPAIR
jgi:DNA-binding transcriptional ArsR family regulator